MDSRLNAFIYWYEKDKYPVINRYIKCDIYIFHLIPFSQIINLLKHEIAKTKLTYRSLTLRVKGFFFGVVVVGTLANRAKLYSSSARVPLTQLMS
jgi:hypothetical protein